jgi:thioredoxin reductase (NADPH)
MADVSNSNEAMFPRLNAVHIARLRPYGRTRFAEAGEILFDQGDSNLGVFVVVSGAIEIVNPSAGGEILITVHDRGEFTGEVNLISGRSSLVRGRVNEASELIEIDRNNLHKIVQTDAEIGEIFLRAFILRRAYLIANTPGDIIVVGSAHSSDTLRLKGFLTRNGYPYTYIDVDRDPDVQNLLDHFEIRLEEIPVLICRGQRILRNPSNNEVAACLDFNPAIDEGTIFDLVVIGAGPSGLAAAVYGASEGLNVLVLENNAPGGQAGSSSRIENYLGFPTGVSGQELADRAIVQAQKFGANIAIARAATQIDFSSQPYHVKLSDGGVVHARSIIVATGATYRKVPLPNLEQYEGNGIYYGATHVEAQLCKGQEVAIVGGGNSAGQAAIFLSGSAKHVHLLVRGAGLSETMSRYLIRRIEDSPDITLHAHTQIEALGGDGQLESLRWRNDQTGVVEERDIHHLYLMTGASPNTDWLAGCLALDDKQFIETGADLSAEVLAAAKWPLQRSPYHLETSMPRVFAVGDVRAGSVKRVASAVGEGSVAVQFVHRALSE